ncbi:hypothetical protein J6590_036844 [Homalodisca vitripennis]|nr:hypothetical protein J6590_036844 [Homalodisca vitripennis]
MSVISNMRQQHKEARNHRSILKFLGDSDTQFLGDSGTQVIVVRSGNNLYRHVVISNMRQQHKEARNHRSHSPVPWRQRYTDDRCGVATTCTDMSVISNMRQQHKEARNTEAILSSWTAIHR